ADAGRIPRRRSARCPTRPSRGLRACSSAAIARAGTGRCAAGACGVRVGRRRDLGPRQLSGPRRKPHSRAFRARRNVLTAALIIGVVVSLALTELVGLSPGGIIVPGYVALLLDRPLALAAFLLIALASYGILRAVGVYLMLYGSRRFAVALLAGMTLSVGAQWTVPLYVPSYLEWVGLGLIVPGLLANQFDRQGVLPTLLMLAIAAPLTRLIVTVVVRL